MKKALLLLVCLIFLCLPVMAQYISIPAEKSASYKAEIETVINNETPVIKHKMDEVVIQYFKSTDDCIKYTLRSIGLDSTLFDLFVKMVKITKRYVPLEVRATDSYYDLEDILYPYLIDNKVNLEGLYRLFDYREYKQKQIGPFPY